MKNAINWFEIPVDNIDRARNFYESIFEIEMQPFEIPNGPSMALFPGDKSVVRGALVCFPKFYKTGQQGPILYLNANPDLLEVQNRVEPCGGKVLIEKRMISEEQGYMAVIEDSEGNRLALHSDQ